MSHETRAVVGEIMRERTLQLGARSVERLHEVLKSPTTDGRTIVAAARAGLEVSGLLRKEAALPIKNMSDLSVAEINELIASTKRELESALRRHAVNGSSDSGRHLCE
jgi:hypothetical protein